MTPSATPPPAHLAAPGRRLPPGPRSPAWLQLLRNVRGPTRFLERCAARYGDDFTLRVTGFGVMVVVSSPETVRQVLTADPSVLVAGAGRSILEPIYGKSSLMLLDDEPHRRQRRLLLPLFRGKAVPAHHQAARDAAERSMATWPTDSPFALHPQLENIAIEVIVRSFLGIEEPARAERLMELFLRFLHAAHNPLVFWLPALVDRLRIGPWRRFHRMRREVDEFLYAEIRRRRAAGVDEDGANEDRADEVLELLLRAVDEEGRSMTETEVRDAFVTILGAGHETTAIALAWAFGLILAHPDVVERIRAEIDVARAGDWLSEEHVGRLEYLDAAIIESMRLYPINPVLPRRARAPVEVGPYVLHAGDYIAPSPYLAQRREESFPEPLRFRPERFLGHRPGAFVMFPFGQGVRRCIGAAFAPY